MDSDSLSILSASGLRVTRQRVLILKILKGEKGHLDAMEIYRRVSRKIPRISLATVYRNLNTLKKTGLVEEVYYDDTHHHYEVSSPGEHYHMLCLGCGKVSEFKFPLIKHIYKEVHKGGDFEIKEVDMRIKGYCSDCQQKEKEDGRK